MLFGVESFVGRLSSPGNDKGMVKLVFVVQSLVFHLCDQGSIPGICTCLIIISLH